MDTSATPVARATFGDILGRSWDLFARLYKVAVPLVLIVYIPIQIFSSLSKSTTSVTHALWIVLAALLSLVGPLWVLTCVTRVTEQSLAGAPAPTLAQAVRLGTGWYRVLGTSLLEAFIVLLLGLVAILIGFGTGRLISPAYGGIVGVIAMIVWLGVVVYLGARWTFAAIISILTAHVGLSALRASSDLVRGQWWRVFGYTILIGLVIGGLSLVVALPYGIVTTLTVGRSMLSELLFSIITDILVAFGLVFTPVFYAQLKSEKGE